MNTLLGRTCRVATVVTTVFWLAAFVKLMTGWLVGGDQGLMWAASSLFTALVAGVLTGTMLANRSAQVVAAQLRLRGLQEGEDVLRLVR